MLSLVGFPNSIQRLHSTQIILLQHYFIPLFLKTIFTRASLIPAVHIFMSSSQRPCLDVNSSKHDPNNMFFYFIHLLFGGDSSALLYTHLYLFIYVLNPVNIHFNIGCRKSDALYFGVFFSFFFPFPGTWAACTWACCRVGAPLAAARLEREHKASDSGQNAAAIYISNSSDGESLHVTLCVCERERECVWVSVSKTAVQAKSNDQWCRKEAHTHTHTHTHAHTHTHTHAHTLS